MIRTMKTGKKERSFWLYTGCFLLLALVLAGVLALHRRLPVFRWDGYEQHYTVLCYISKTVRGLARGEGFALCSPYLGQGMDVLTTLSYYGLTDPLNLLSALFTEDRIWIAYILIAVLRLWLSGLAFMLFAGAMGCKNGWARAMGGVMYAFCGFALYNLARHTYFINGMLYLPLLLLGAERVLRRGRWLAYALTVAVMLLACFYFAWIDTLLTVVWILARLAVRAPKRGLSGTARDGGLLLAGYILGALLSAAVLLPVALAFLDNARLGVAAGFSGSWHYELRYYLRLLATAFIAEGTAGHWTVLALSPLALFGLLLLPFARGRSSAAAFAGILLCALGLCFPIVGRIMNGGGYVVNRWCYALTFFLCLGSASSLPVMTEEQRAWVRWTAAAAVLLWGAGCTAYIALFSRLRLLQILEVLLAVALAVLYGAGILNRLDAKGARRAVTAFLLLTLVCQEAVFYDATDQYEEMLGFDIAEAYASETPAALVEAGTVGRVEHRLLRDPHALTKEYRGTGYYWSMIPSAIAGYYRSLGLPTQAAMHMMPDLGGSAEMCAAASVAACVPAGDLPDGQVPWGFEPGGSVQTPDGKSWEVYENRYALPFGCTFDTALSVSEWESLPVERRIQALTACAICDSPFVPAAKAPDGGTILSWEAGEAQGITGTDREISAEEGARVTLRFEAPEDSEVWLIAEKPRVSCPDEVITARTGGSTTMARLIGRDNNLYFDRPVLALCLGGAESVSGSCTLTFRDASGIVWDAFRAVALPMAEFRGNVERRREEALEDVSWENDRVTGNITVSGDRILQLSLPYSRGWSARVDGRRAELFPCGGMYCGVALTEGTHEIELRYVTPGLRAGVALSALGLLGMLLLGILRRRYRKVREGIADQGA